MNSFDRRLERMEERYLPAPPTAFDRKLLQQIADGVRRVREDREAHGLSPADDEEGLPAPRLHTSQGIQLTIELLHEGRERNHLRCLRDNQNCGSAPLATGGE